MSKVRIVPRVIPGLSVKAKELERRMSQRSITIESGGKQYSDDPEVTSLFNMNRTDLLRSHVNEAKRVQKLKESLNEEQGRVRKAEELARIEKIKADAIAEHLKKNSND